MNIKKIIDSLKHPFSFPVLILGIIYICWLFTAPMSLFDDNLGNYLTGIFLLAIYILLIFLAKVASNDWKFTLIFIVFALPLIFWLTFYVTWFLSRSQYFGEYTLTFIFILEMLLATIYAAIKLLSKSTSKNRKTSLVLFITMLPVLGASFVYPMQFYPEILDEAKLGNHKYYITSSVDWDNHSYQSFYKCLTWRFGCRELSFSYSGFTEIIVDEESNEVSLLGYFGLDYTDGEHSRSYSQPATTFGDHIYQFSDTCNNFNNKEGYYRCESYTYTLYECNLDYKSCNPLPIQYTTEDYDILLFLDGDNVNKEINIYSDYPEYGGILIFTYGEHPRCYVEGCEILNETK